MHKNWCFPGKKNSLHHWRRQQVLRPIIIKANSMLLSTENNPLHIVHFTCGTSNLRGCAVSKSTTHFLKRVRNIVLNTVFHHRSRKVEAGQWADHLSLELLLVMKTYTLFGDTEKDWRGTSYLNRSNSHFDLLFYKLNELKIPDKKLVCRYETVDWTTMSCNKNALLRHLYI